MRRQPLKFRCFACLQLLGISPTKAGAVIACPKCGAELIVPDPPESDPPLDLEIAPPDEPGADPAEDLRSALAAPLPPDLFEIRPEDIRAEPGAGRVERSSQPDPRASTPLPQPEPAPTLAAPPESRPAPAPPRPRPRVETAPRPVSRDEHGPLEIRIDPSDESPAAHILRDSRHRDVVLPRGAVVAWSVFALFGLVSAFLTGLLIGHFLWKS